MIQRINHPNLAQEINDESRLSYNNNENNNKNNNNNNSKLKT